MARSSRTSAPRGSRARMTRSSSKSWRRCLRRRDRRRTKHRLALALARWCAGDPCSSAMGDIRKDSCCSRIRRRATRTASSRWTRRTASTPTASSFAARTWRCGSMAKKVKDRAPSGSLRTRRALHPVRIECQNRHGRGDLAVREARHRQSEPHLCHPDPLKITLASRGRSSATTSARRGLIFTTWAGPAPHERRAGTRCLLRALWPAQIDRRRAKHGRRSPDSTNSTPRRCHACAVPMEASSRCHAGHARSRTDASRQNVHLNADATSFEMIDNEIRLPKEFTNESKGDQIICERHIWNDADGGATMVVWSRKAVKLPDGRNNTVRMSHLMRSTDEGKTWNHFSTIGPGGEPAVCRLSATEQTAVIRGDRNSRMKQMFSHDAGKTWTKPVELEVGRVLPDLVLMSNGVLACSYGRPASCLMFSLDGGKTWPFAPRHLRKSRLQLHQHPRDQPRQAALHPRRAEDECDGDRCGTREVIICCENSFSHRCRSPQPHPFSHSPMREECTAQSS
jgi:hypothetical protein